MDHWIQVKSGNLEVKSVYTNREQLLEELGYPLKTNICTRMKRALESAIVTQEAKNEGLDPVEALMTYTENRQD